MSELCITPLFPSRSLHLSTFLYLSHCLVFITLSISISKLCFSLPPLLTSVSLSIDRAKSLKMERERMEWRKIYPIHFISLSHTLHHSHPLPVLFMCLWCAVQFFWMEYWHPSWIKKYSIGASIRDSLPKIRHFHNALSPYNHPSETHHTISAWDITWNSPDRTRRV